MSNEEPIPPSPEGEVPPLVVVHVKSPVASAVLEVLRQRGHTTAFTLAVSQPDGNPELTVGMRPPMK